MRRLQLLIVALLVGALVALAAGCGGSDPGEAQTPANAPTITNGQGGSGTSTGGGATSTGGGGGGGGAADPAVAAGKTFFEGTCQTCHGSDGTVAVVGPVLAKTGLTEAKIRNQVTNGGGAMPAGLAKGTDLDNVVKFVLSIQ